MLCENITFKRYTPNISYFLKQYSLSTNFCKDLLKNINDVKQYHYKISIFSPDRALFILLTAQNLPHILQVSL